jgi:hypothetical protein
VGSSSSSSTNQTVNNNDRRQTLDGSLGISGDGNWLSNTTTTNTDNSFHMITSLSNSGNTTTNYLDGGAIKGAFDFGGRALDTVDTTVAGAFDFGKTALDYNNKALNASLNATTAAVNSAFSYGSQSQQQAYQFSTGTVKSAFELIGDANHITADLVKKNADLNAAAVSQVATAWDNAKQFEAGKSLGDYKYILLAAVAIVALMAFRKG